MKVNVNGKQYELATYAPVDRDGLWKVYVLVDKAERFCADGETKSEAINNAMLDISFAPHLYQ